MTEKTDGSDSAAPTTGDQEAAWDQFGTEYDLPRFEGTPRTWMLASTARSGSHYLGHLLAETGALGAPLEYLGTEHVKRWKKKLEVDDFADVLEYLHAHRTAPTGWFGVKAHWFQFARFATSQRLRDLLQVERYVVIRRQDRLAQAISLVMARQTKAWISFREAKREPRYDADAIREAMATVEHQVQMWDAYFTQYGVTPLVVEYEELLTDAPGTVDRVLQWFEVEPQPGTTRPLQRPARQANAINQEWERRFLAES